MDNNKTITAFVLETRTWTYHPLYGYGCNECCTGDRCDNDCKRLDRNKCPHCKGKGWIKEEDIDDSI